jgi:dihydroorotase
MPQLIRQVCVFAPGSPHHGQTTDLLLENGTIVRIGRDLPAPDRCREIRVTGLCVSPGWLDLFGACGEPGLEHREDFATAARAAHAGGFRAVCLLPNTRPALHGKSEIGLVRSARVDAPVELLPLGALTRNCEGTEPAEIYDMHAAGAVAFSDGKNPVQHAGVMLRALQYTKPFGGLVIQSPLDKQLGGGGHLHEGRTSTLLGLRGLPALAEDVMVQRDLRLLEYTGSRLHLANLSTAESVALVREAKARGLAVTASVNPLNLFFTDEALLDFDTNLKVMPPLRDESHRQALIAGLLDGTIDCFVSNHMPLDPESKELEFPYASFGAIGWETAFAALRTALWEVLTWEQIVQKLAVEPWKILGLQPPAVAEGQPDRLTFFLPDEPWTFSGPDIRSKSHNSPFIGRSFRGKPFSLNP